MGRAPRPALALVLLASLASGCGGDEPGPAPGPAPAPVAPAPRPRSRDEVATFTQILVGYRSERFPDTFRRSAAEARAIADDLVAKLRAGASMERLVEQHTDDRNEEGKPFNDGTYTIARGVTPVMPAVEKAVFSLRKGEILPTPLDTGVAFLVLRRED